MGNCGGSDDVVGSSGWPATGFRVISGIAIGCGGDAVVGGCGLLAPRIFRLSRFRGLSFLSEGLVPSAIILSTSGVRSALRFVGYPDAELLRG